MTVYCVSGLGMPLSTQWLIAHPIVMELTVIMERQTFYGVITLKVFTVNEGRYNLEGENYPGK